MALGVRDLRRVLAFLEDAQSVDEPAPFTPELLDGLAELVGCEEATFFENDHARRVMHERITRAASTAPFDGVPDDQVDLDRARPWAAHVMVLRSRDFTERERLMLQLLRPHLGEDIRARPTILELTQREREVLGLVAEGLTNMQIARTLWVAESTVAKHLEQAYGKLGVHSRTAAVAKLRKLPA